MTFGSLFTGVGGADLGLERAGLSPLWGCEFDRACQDVLRYRRPGLPIYPDVRSFPADECEVPDVLWMSPPCQDLSVAGKRAGLSGQRSGLFYDAVRIAVRLRDRGTRWVLMEQVPGLLSSNAGEDMRSVCDALLELGVSVAYRVLDSQFFGVPQRRRRVFFVVDLRGERAHEVLALAQGLRGDSPPSREKGERVTGCVTAGAHPGSYNGQDAYNDRLIPEIAGTLGSGGESPRGWANDLDRSGAFIPSYSIQERAVSDNPDAGPQGKGWQEDVAYTLEARHHVQATAHTLRAEGFDASEDGTGRGTPLVPIHYAISGRARGDDGRGYERADQILEDKTGAIDTVKPFAVAGPTMAVRRLTPRECERLQGWPDDHTRYATKPDGTVYEQADGPRYKQCGNGVTANVSEWIAKNLLATHSVRDLDL